MSFADLPTLNALLNGLCTLFLVMGFAQIKKGNRQGHRKFMIAALATSVAFLASYVVYHLEVGSVPYPHYDWTRTLYFGLLIPHILLAAVNVPFIFLTVWHAAHQDFARHKKLARFVWPSWMFVSVTGVIIYLMLYRT
jgi:putative membrane protein